MGSSQGRAQKNHKEEEKCFVFKEMVKKSLVSNPQTHYKFLEKIGEGSYAEVYKVQSLSTGQIRVIKKVQRHNSPTLGKHLLNQFQILRQMDHPNIIKMFEMFQDQKYHYIVTEYLQGKDAFDMLVSLKTVDESRAFNLVYQCLLSLNYLHKNKVMHRDVKLENIIYDEETLCFKLIDFGSALRFTSYSPQQRRRTGTIHYMPPQVINKYYNMKCDVWSLGVLLYVLLSGSAPFSGQSHESIVEKILKAPLNFNKPIWESRSKEVKYLISRMLEKNLENRPSIAQLLKDPWILHHKSLQSMHKCQIESICLSLERLLKFRKLKLTDIQLGILLFMINFIIKTENQIALIQAFLKIDSLEQGQINEKQVKEALMSYLKMDCKSASKAAKEIMEKIDLDASGDISFSQFVLGATDLRNIITSQNLTQTFQYIDSDNSQTISMIELQERLGDHLETNQYKKLVTIFDSNCDGQIDFSEFSKMMTDLLKQY